MRMNLPDNIVVIGAGGHAKVVIATVRALGGSVVRVYDDDESRWGQTLLGVPVAGPILSQRIGNSPAVLAIGDNRVRRTLSTRLKAEWMTVCHPKAVVDSSVIIGLGTVVFAGAVIQPDTEIGAHCIVNTSASIDHDCSVGDYVHVGPGVTVCGGVRVEEGALLGVGAKVAPLVRVGQWSTVGAGAVCVQEVPSRSTVVGVPAAPVGAR
jgi:sugar O-acyltransferase (sialic acid O-acetyltransferase NeuD family)